jgi:hypothetical protein
MVSILCSNVIAADRENPFAKARNINFDAEWDIKGKTATKSGSDSGTFYHLFYDKKQLRLRMTGGAEDSDATVKKYEKFAVEDVQVDGERLPIFQWCLKNQQRHARFLQQGLSVRNNICVNDGAKGAFIMRLNVATVESLKKGSKLSFVISPFRSSMTVTFDVSDFDTLAGKLGAKVIKAAAKAPAKKCEVTPPKGFSEIGGVGYICGDDASKAEANAAITVIVNEERERRIKKKQAEKAKRQKESEAKRKELAAKKAQEERVAAEAAALAASAAQQEAIGSVINNKMIAVCKKKWAAGEHRCYCEKYLDQAPAGIKSDPSC